LALAKVARRDKRLRPICCSSWPIRASTTQREGSGFVDSEKERSCLERLRSRSCRFRFESVQARSRALLSMLPAVAVGSRLGEVSTVINGIRVSVLGTQRTSVYAVCSSSGRSSTDGSLCPVPVCGDHNFSIIWVNVPAQLCGFGWLRNLDRGGGGGGSGRALSPSLDAIARSAV